MNLRSTSSIPNSFFWSCCGLALLIFAFGSSWSLVRSGNYQLQVANNRLEVTRYLESAKIVNEAINKTITTVPMPQKTRKNLRASLEASEAALRQSEQEVAQEVDQLLDLP